MTQFVQDVPQSAIDVWIQALNQNFSLSMLSSFIDFTSLGWILFFLTFMVYVLSKDQWMRLRIELQRLVMIDPLTLLPNRRLFEDRAGQLLKVCQRQEAGFAIILGDLDFFKLVNDSMGHQAGDILLKELAERFSQAIRGEDTVARLGGDEFVFLIQGVKEPADIEHVTQRIYACLEEPIAVQDATFNIGISMGIAFYPEQGLTVESLLRRADLALYRAKAVKNTYEIYNDEDDDLLCLNHIAKHNDLRKVG